MCEINILSIVYRGILIIILIMFIKFFVYNKMKIIVKGWIFNVFFIMLGEIKWFLKNWISVYIIVNFNNIKGEVIIVIIIVGDIVIVGFK